MDEVFSLRLPPEVIKRLRRHARRSRLGPTQLARTWILERLSVEGDSRGNTTVVREREPGYATQAQTRTGTPRDHLPQIDAICRRRGVKRLGLFGSAARDDFDPVRSDLDFTVEYLDMPLGLRPRSYFGLIEDLQQLFSRRVDLVDRNAVSNPYLREAIERDEVTLYEAS